MPKISTYTLPPTPLIPNSPYPLIHYPQYFPPTTTTPALHTLFARNGWQTQWIYRYGPTQPSHYHSTVHECMAVLTGTATIRFGAADEEGNGTGTGTRTRSLEIRAQAGDVFVVPAGVAHKTFDPHPAESTFALLTPGDGHGVAIATATTTTTTTTTEKEDQERQVLATISLSGFTMLGAYPYPYPYPSFSEDANVNADNEASSSSSSTSSSDWDFAVAGDHVGSFEDVWHVPRPRLDPVLGGGREGVCGLWGDVSVRSD